MSFKETILFRVGADVSGLDKDMAKADGIIQRRISAATKKQYSIAEAFHRWQVNNDEVRHKIRMNRIAAENKAIAAGSGGFSWVGKEKEKVSWLKKTFGFGGSEGGHGGGGAGGIVNELGVIVREAAAGRWSNLSRSMGVIAQRSGLLGKALTALASPVGIAAAAVTGLGIAVYGFASGAQNLMRNAQNAGFSSGGYQDLLNRAGHFGERESAQKGIQNLAQLIGGAQMGDEGAFKKFKAHGIDVGGKTTEQIYRELQVKLNGEKNATLRARMGQEFFGGDYEGMQRTLLSGQAGNRYGGGSKYSDAQLQSLSNIAEGGKGLWNGIKEAGAGLLRLGGKGVAGIGQLFTQPFGGSAVYQESASNAAVAEQKAFLQRRNRSAAEKQAEIKEKDFQLYEQLRDARVSNEKIGSQLGDENKNSLDNLAEQGRRFTGQRHRRNWHITEGMRVSLKIQDLEEQAKVASEEWTPEGEAKRAKFSAQADSLRSKYSQYLKYDEGHKREEMMNNIQKSEEHLQYLEGVGKAITETMLH